MHVATTSMWPPHQATNAKYCKLLNHKIVIFGVAIY